MRTKTKTVIAFLGVVSAGFLSAGVAQASGSPIVGTYTFIDLGQGGWQGGPLRSDGSIGGGGAFSFGNGQNVGRIQGLSWAPAGPDAVTLCFTDTATKGNLLFPSPSCFTLPVTGTPIVISEEPGERTLLRVHLNQ